MSPLNPPLIPRRTSAIVWVVLLLLLLLNWGLARLQLGVFNLVASLAIPLVQMLLMLLYLMHVRYSPPLTRVFVASGLITGFAGCVLAAKLRIGQANVGLDYLLPALVGAFLGSTTIKPGRVNVWGTMFGVLILAVGISGIQQLGGAFFVEPLFNGTTLVISIALAAFAQRRRTVARPTRVETDSS